METQYIAKREYRAPAIERIKLDNEISLALESMPPTGPDEGYTKAPDYLNNDPFNTTVV